MNEVWLISGIPASGKTATSKKLAESLNKSVYISADELRTNNEVLSLLSRFKIKIDET